MSQPLAGLQIFLLADLLLECPQRSRTIANMTVKDLKSARTVVDKKGKPTYTVIEVAKHKTASTTEPLHISLDLGLSPRFSFPQFVRNLSGRVPLQPRTLKTSWTRA